MLKGHDNTENQLSQVQMNIHKTCSYLSVVHTWPIFFYSKSLVPYALSKEREDSMIHTCQL